MTNATIFLALILGSGVATVGWLSAFILTRDGRWSEEAAQVIFLDRLKLVLIAVLAVITIGLAITVNNVSKDIHDLKVDCPSCK